MSTKQSHLAHSASSHFPNPRVQSIRLVSGTPFAQGLSSTEGLTAIRGFDSSMSTDPTPWDSVPPPPTPPTARAKPSTSKLLPKKKSAGGLENATSTSKRLVPKKSKLRMLGSLGSRDAWGKEKDFDLPSSEAEAPQDARSGSAKLRGGFDIYVDPVVDPDMDDIVVVKKQKSRAALDDMGWGPTSASLSRGALSDLTNTPHVDTGGKKEKEGTGTMRLKGDDEKKWWSISRGRKDSKDERKPKEKESSVVRMGRASSPPPRSQTPEPFKSTNGSTEQPRARFNSLDAGVMLGFSSKKSSSGLAAAITNDETVESSSGSPSPPPTLRVKALSNAAVFPQTQHKRMERIATPPQMAYSRSAAPSFGKMFGPSSAQTGGTAASKENTNATNQGSIALRAMRSVKSLARIGTWSQHTKDDKDIGPSSLGRREKKDKKEKPIKEVGEQGEKKTKHKKSFSGTLSMKRKPKNNEGTERRNSSSSFEAGTSSPSAPAKAETFSRKQSILGIGLPSSMRLPSMHKGSTSSSILAGGAPNPKLFGTVNANTISASGAGSTSSFKSNPSGSTITANRLSADSVGHRDAYGRRGSVQSTASSLRPDSITSTISGGSTGSRASTNRISSGSSVRWDEEGLHRARVEREKDTIAKRTSIKDRRKAAGADRGNDNKESRRNLDARKRTALTDIFPEIAATAGAGSSGLMPSLSEAEGNRYPIVTIEGASSDGHVEVLKAVMEESEGEHEQETILAEREEAEDVVATPVKQARTRPVSEGVLGKPRPEPLQEDEHGVLSVLSAATNDLAQLINHLDLEATPSTLSMTPSRPPSPRSTAHSSKPMTRSMSLQYTGSPKKKMANDAKGLTIRPSIPSISSLRPYAQSRVASVNSGHPTLRGKPSTSDILTKRAIPTCTIPEKTSLAELRAKLKPVTPKTSTEPSPSSPLSHLFEVPTPPQPYSQASLRPQKRLSAPAREVDPTPALQPLKPPPSKTKTRAMPVFTKPAKSSPERVKDTFDGSEEDDDRYQTLRAGKKQHSRGPSEMTFGTIGRGSVQGSRTSRGSAMSTVSYKSSTSHKRSVTEVVDSRAAPIGREIHRYFGRPGTLGGGDDGASDAGSEMERSESDDSDIPEELRRILLKSKSQTVSYGRRSGSSRVQEEEERQVGEDDGDDDKDDASFTGRFHFLDSPARGVAPRTAATPPAMLAPPSRGVSPYARMSTSSAEIQEVQRLPVFRAQLITDTAVRDADFDDDSVSSSDENATKRSFDFTGELAKLNHPSVTNRKSFVEQLENAFKTPAKVDLRTDFGVGLEESQAAPPLPEFNSFEVTSTSSDPNRYESDESSIGVGRDCGAFGFHSMEMDMSAFVKGIKVKPSRAVLTRDSPRPLFDESVSMVVPEVKQPSLDLPSLKSTPSGTANSSVANTPFNLKAKAPSPSSRHSAKTSAGELNRSFKFGGSPANLAPTKFPVFSDLDSLVDDLTLEYSDCEEGSASGIKKPATLSDIIPPPSRVRETSFSSSMLDEFEDSGLKFSLAPPVEIQPPPQAPRNAPNVQARERPISMAPPQNARFSRRMSNFIPLSRPASGVSFTGFDSFEEFRRGFEFNDQRAGFYPGQAPNHLVGARRRAEQQFSRYSMFSIASVSSYGRVVRDGVRDPFDYDVASPAMSTIHSDYENDTFMSMSSQVDDTFSFIQRRPVQRRRVDSNASNYSFHAPVQPVRAGRWRDSVVSNSGLPPVSIYNRNFGRRHRKTSSIASASSVALSYANAGGMGGRAIIARHHRTGSSESLESQFSARRHSFARPGLGEKMFDMDHGGHLNAIAGSPSQSVYGNDSMSMEYGQNRMSAGFYEQYDSIMDGGDGAYRRDCRRDSIAEEYEEEYAEEEHRRRFSTADSLFDRSEENSKPLSSNESVFGDDDCRMMPVQQYRPVSVFSVESEVPPIKDDDTMFSMIGGGHVRRSSIGSMIGESPCVRRGNTRRPTRNMLQNMQKVQAPTVPVAEKNKVLQLKPSIAPSQFFQVNGDRATQPQHGFLQRPKVEQKAPVEHKSLPFQKTPVFSRPPPPATRDRSSTCSTATSATTERDTPPLSPSGGSMSGGSFSSIDIRDVHSVLTSSANPGSTFTSARALTREHGHGHRRRYSQVPVSRGSIYETIEEEYTASETSLAKSILDGATKKLSTEPTAVYIVGSDTESIPEDCVWDDERGIVALRKYYHLKDEAQCTVRESQVAWRDTPSSLFALQAFQPPRHFEGMKAMLEQSLRTYGPLPAELRRIRSRKNSRPSPYPQTMFMNAPQPTLPSMKSFEHKGLQVLQEKRTNVAPSPEILRSAVLKPSTLAAKKGVERSAKKETIVAEKSTIRPRLPSTGRKSTVGLSKQANVPKVPTVKKENAIAAGSGSIGMTSGDSLRLNRPRPRAARTTASQARTVRI